MPKPKEKIYYPQTIDNQPLPNQVEEASFATSQTTGGQTFSTQKIKDQSLPAKRIAVELLSSALNTKTRKILAEFEFTEHGAIRIGKYVNGVSGDLRFTPNGLVARNKSGITTFAIDGDTGNAVFKGSIQSGSLITGQVVVGNGRVVIDGEDEGKITIKDDTDTTVIDAKGLVSTTSFTKSDTVLNAGSQTITSDGDEDITGATLTFTLKRESVVVILATSSGYMGLDAGDSGNGYVFIDVDGTEYFPRSHFYSGSLETGATHLIATLAAGSHTVKMVGHLSLVANTPIFNIYSYRLSYVVLGK